MQAHPDVPVVENLEDLWMVSKLQAERKEREAAAKRVRLAHMQACPPAHVPLILTEICDVFHDGHLFNQRWLAIRPRVSFP